MFQPLAPCRSIEEYVGGLEPIPSDQERDSSSGETSADSSSGSESEVLWHYVSFFIVSGLHQRNVRDETKKIFAGCKESQFYSLPFGQAAANMTLAHRSFQLARKNFLMSKFDYNSSII